MFRETALGQYHPMSSAVHRLSPRTELFRTMVLIISLFVIDNIWGYVTATAVLAAAIKLIRVLMRLTLRGLKVIMILLLVNVSFNLFLTDRRIPAKFWIFEIALEGVRMVLSTRLRLIYLVIGSSIMTLVTTPNQLTDGLEKDLGFLKRFRVPVHEVATMISIALRLILILVEETDKIIKTQMARGANFKAGNPIQKVKAMVLLLVPLSIFALRRATDPVMAMEVRCYYGGDGRIKMKPLQYRQTDHDTYMVYVLYFVVVIASRVHL